MQFTQISGLFITSKFGSINCPKNELILSGTGTLTRRSSEIPQKELP